MSRGFGSVGAGVLGMLMTAPCIAFAQPAAGPDAERAEVHALERRAASGDKLAQRDLGDRYENGDGVPRDPARATRLFAAAGGDTGGSRMMYVPQRNGSVSAVPVSGGAVTAGIPQARAHSRNGLRAGNRLDWYEVETSNRNKTVCLVYYGRQTLRCKRTGRNEAKDWPDTSVYYALPFGNLVADNGGDVGCTWDVCLSRKGIIIGNDLVRQRQKIRYFAVVYDNGEIVCVVLFTIDNVTGKKSVSLSVKPGASSSQSRRIISALDGIIKD